MIKTLLLPLAAAAVLASAGTAETKPAAAGTIHYALFVRLEAKPGKEQALADFLATGLAMANRETTTPIWFALRLFGHPVNWATALVLESMTRPRAMSPSMTMSSR